MSNLTKFESAKLPAHLTKLASLFGDSSALITRSGPSYDVLTIKGKVWRVVDHITKERVALRNPEGEILQAVRVHIVRANPAASKVFYREGYEEGSDTPPDCFSNDGIKPDAIVKSPESKTCAACPHHVWGSGKDGKGRACSDSRRIAVAPENNPDKVMLLRVPAASLKSLSDFGKQVDARGFRYQQVIAKIEFDIESASPKLIFTPVDFGSEEAIERIAEMQEDEVVRAICGFSDASDSAKGDVDEEEVEAPKPEVKAKSKAPKPEPRPAPAPAQEEEEDVVEVVEQKAKQVTRAAPEELPADISDMLDALGLDD